MRVQYISDIHLEMYKENVSPDLFTKLIRPEAPYLALCGDIGIPDFVNYENFLNWCSRRWTKVFLVAGNHEYYNWNCPVKTDMEAKKAMIQKMCDSLKNVYFLDYKTMWLSDEKIRILGCTLWSDIDQNLIDEASKETNDYRQIFVEGTKPGLPGLLRELHYKERSWLQQEIHKADLTGERCLVLTHYLPSYELVHTKYKAYANTSYFASHCDNLIRPPVIGWICGHSHAGAILKIHGIPCALNPVGYPGENPVQPLSMSIMDL